ncbi:rod shape-determining protein MreC [Treponema sp.]|uniref:rod shape-determining protein MreC n=1 Tax=Treponema sp. TaxID=166 RepID=UPI003FA29F6A
MQKRKIAYTFKFSLILLTVFVIVSGSLLGLSTGNFIIDFKQTGFSVLSAAQRGVGSAVTGTENTVNAIRELSRLKDEYEKLSEKLKNYEYMQRSNAEIKKENERLNTLLDFSQKYEYKNIAARIIARDADNLYAAITVDKGNKHGVKKNMPVIAVQKGTVGLVGKIVTVGAYTSMIMPVYDFQCSVSARIQHTRDLGLISGTGSPDIPLKMSYIKKRVLEELQFGDIIVTSGENGNYVREIPIGTVHSVSVVDYDTSLLISVMPIVDFSRLEEVIIIDTSQANSDKNPDKNPDKKEEGA